MKPLYTLFLFLLLALAAFAPALAAWETPGVPTQQLAEIRNLPTPGITATVRTPSFTITSTDVADAVKKQLIAENIATNAEVKMQIGAPEVLYSADHPVKLTLHALQVDPASKRWQAQAYILGNGKTESVKPISGVYTALVEVPVLKHTIGRGSVIEESDIVTLSLAERLVRKETVTEAKDLIGKAPRMGISANRPIQQTELAAPIVIKRGELVEMEFSTPYMKIKTTGIALEDGAAGLPIRVKNQKSERAVSARVVSAGRVTVNSETPL